MKSADRPRLDQQIDGEIDPNGGNDQNNRVPIFTEQQKGRHERTGQCRFPQELAKVDLLDQLRYGSPMLGEIDKPGQQRRPGSANQSVTADQYPTQYQTGYQVHNHNSQGNSFPISGHEQLTHHTGQ